MMRIRRLLFCLLAGSLALAAAGSAVASTSGVVVSEFRFRGVDGNDEFVELLNTSLSSVDISGWRLQGCAAASGAPSARATVASGTVLAPGQHFLFVNAAGTVAGDVSYATGISDTGGARITLADGTTAVDGVGSSDGAVDECREGAGLAIPTTNGDNSFERKAAGTQDTDDNAADFVGPKPGNPEGFGAPTGPVVAEIHEIQGAGHISPLDGKNVADVEGIVTARRLFSGRGFYMQDATPDADDATSDGIFVFTGSTPTVAVGDAVEVSGTVSEFRPGSDPENLTITQIGSPSITVMSSGNPVPETLVGPGGRTPPTEVIEDDATGDVETSGIFDPASDGIDFYESLEGMHVRIDDAVVVGPRNNFGEVAVLAANGAGAGIRTARGGIVIRPTDFNPERIILDDVLQPTPSVDVADSFPGSLRATVDYSFGNFKFLVTTALAPVDGGLAREVTVAPVDQEIAVATFNVENLHPGNPPAKFAELAGLIVNNLRSPDLIGIEEVQDNDGPTNSAVTDASASWAALISAIQAAGGPTYEYRQIDPVDDQDGGQPGGNIRVGFLFRTDRGLSFIDRPGGGPTTATTVVAHPSGPQLSASPGRIAPSDPAFVDTRKSLVGEFRARGKKLFVIVNHFSSKGDDQPLFGRFQPPTRFTETARHAQAQVVNDFVDEILDVDPDADVIVLGDINDFEFSQTVTILKGGVLENLVDTLPQAERYSYVFEGNSQVLDQILVSDHLFAQFPITYDVVHVNSEFADQASDHEPSVARLNLTGMS
jgi:predicted extracellular nuclease